MQFPALSSVGVWECMQGYSHARTKDNMPAHGRVLEIDFEHVKISMHVENLPNSVLKLGFWFLFVCLAALLRGQNQLSVVQLYLEIDVTSQGR